MTTPPHPLHLKLLTFFFLTLAESPIISAAIGVNWGTASSHPLPPHQVVALLKSNAISKVKLFDADPAVLRALSGSNIDVTLGIPNSSLRALNSSLKAAESWVHDNVTRYLTGGSPSTVRIQYISVGDESFLVSHGEQFYPFVVGAATNIRTALVKAKLGSEIKVVVPCSLDSVDSESGLPSKGHFRPDINKTMTQLLKFLTDHHSPFFVTISPFETLLQSNNNTSLDFALFKETARPHNDSRRIYRSSFDLSYDTLVTALYNGGFPQMEIVIGRIGWPTDGAANATSHLAEQFMRGLIHHLKSKSGTPLRPHSPPSETYLFSLLDEDKRSVSWGNHERHWGVFTFDGQAKYQVNLGTKKLVNAQNVEYLPLRWCVVNNNNNNDLSNAATVEASEACSASDCTAMSPGGSCFNISWPGNISYAFNSYYQQHNQTADSCYFGGLGLVTTVDPSTESCRFYIGLHSFSSSLLDTPLRTSLVILLMLFLIF